MPVLISGAGHLKIARHCIIKLSRGIGQIPQVAAGTARQDIHCALLYSYTQLRLYGVAVLQLLIATKPIIYSVAEHRGDWYGEQKVCQTTGMR